MSRVLLKVSVALMLLLSGAALYMGYLLFDQRDELKGRTQTLEESVKRIASTIETGDETGETIVIPDVQLRTLDTMSAPLSRLEAAAKYQLDRFNAMRRDRVDIKETLAELEEGLKTKTADLEQTTKKYDEVVGTIAERDKAITEQKVLIGNLEREKAEFERKIATLEDNVQALQVENRDLTDKAAELSARLGDVEARADPSRISAKLVKGRQGVILHVDPAWNFVIFSIAPGSLDKIVPEAELLVHRGTKFLGKVRVTNVESHLAVANILSDWQQAAMKEHDEVIH